jgi:hypothetical protein
MAIRGIDDLRVFRAALGDAGGWRPPRTVLRPAMKRYSFAERNTEPGRLQL